MRAKMLLTEDPADLGNMPDFIDPGRKQKLSTHGHPYGKNPAFPKEVPPPREGSKIRSYAELVASEVYPEIIRKVARYTGIQPNRQHPAQLVRMMMQAMQQVVQLEQGHEEELEQAAVGLVLGLSEYQSAREAHDSGELIIRAKLRPDVDLEGAQMEAPEDEEEAEVEVAQVAQELDIEVQKRKFVNLLVHGSAMTKNYAFHLVDDLLNRIDPRLLNLYGVLMSVGELGYWMFPEEMMGAGMGGGAAASAGGSVRVTWENGVPVINAQGIAFPVLVQEIVKGLMEYLSFPDEDDPGTRQYAMDKADLLSEEPWAITLGPGVWKHILRAIGDDNHDLMPHVYDHLMKLPPSEFNRLYHGMLRGDADSKRWITDLVQQLRNELNTEESADDIAGRLLS